MSLEYLALILTVVSALFMYIDKKMPESAIRKFNDWLRQSGEEVLEYAFNVKQWQLAVFGIVSFILTVFLISAYDNSQTDTISSTLIQFLRQPMNPVIKLIIMGIPWLFTVILIASLVVMATYWPSGVWGLLGFLLWVAEPALEFLMKMS